MGLLTVTVGCFYNVTPGTFVLQWPGVVFEQARGEALYTSYFSHIMQSKKVTNAACPYNLRCIISAIYWMPNTILSDSHTTVHSLVTKPYRIGTITQEKELFSFFFFNKWRNWGFEKLLDQDHTVTKCLSSYLCSESKGFIIKNEQFLHCNWINIFFQADLMVFFFCFFLSSGVFL